jgi:hypothetical protein
MAAGASKKICELNKRVQTETLNTILIYGNKESNINDKRNERGSNHMDNAIRMRSQQHS